MSNLFIGSKQLSENINKIELDSLDNTKTKILFIK